MTDKKVNVREIKMEKPEPEKYAEFRKKKENRVLGLYITVFAVGLLLVALTEHVIPKVEPNPSESFTRTMTVLRFAGRACVGFGIAASGFLAALKLIERDVKKQEREKDAEFRKERKGSDGRQ